MAPQQGWSAHDDPHTENLLRDFVSTAVLVGNMRKGLVQDLGALPNIYSLKLKSS